MGSPFYLNSNCCCCFRLDVDKFEEVVADDDDDNDDEVVAVVEFNILQLVEAAEVCNGDLCLRFKECPVDGCGTIVILLVLLLVPPPIPHPTGAVRALIDVPGKQRYNEIDGGGNCIVNFPF